MSLEQRVSDLEVLVTRMAGAGGRGFCLHPSTGAEGDGPVIALATARVVSRSNRTVFREGWRVQLLALQKDRENFECSKAADRRALDLKITQLLENIAREDKADEA